MPQTFFHDSPYSRKYVLLRLPPYHWQTCISQFCDIKKDLYLLSISTGCQGLQVPEAAAKFSDLVIGRITIFFGQRTGTVVVLCDVSGDLQKKKRSSLQRSTCSCECASGLHKRTKNWDIFTNRRNPETWP